jgi:hypothetical protein
MDRSARDTLVVRAATTFILLNAEDALVAEGCGTSESEKWPGVEAQNSGRREALDNRTFSG